MDKEVKLLLKQIRVLLILCIMIWSVVGFLFIFHSDQDVNTQPIQIFLSTPTPTPLINTLMSSPEPQIEVKTYTDEDLYWLAKIVYAEAGYDVDEGQQAVANVVLNRVNSPDFPDTIYDVIWQKTGKVWQFSPCGDGGINKEPDERAIENARIILEGKRIIPEDVLFFYMPTNDNVKDWIRTREIYKKIGVHRFCY